MVSTKVTSALMGAVYASSVAAFGNSDKMGPAAIMWPADRPWSDKHDNTAPCGSDASVGERTPFPLSESTQLSPLRPGPPFMVASTIRLGGRQ